MAVAEESQVRSRLSDSSAREKFETGSSTCPGAVPPFTHVGDWEEDKISPKTIRKECQVGD
jgi:hypothetical protein